MTAHVEGLNRVSDWVRGGGGVVPVGVVREVLCDADPVGRDILIGMVLSYPDEFGGLLSGLGFDGPDGLNVVNLLLVVGGFNGFESGDLVERGRVLSGSGVVGTTLFDMLVSEMDIDGVVPDSVLEGLGIAGAALAEDYGVRMP